MACPRDHQVAQVGMSEFQRAADDSAGLRALAIANLLSEAERASRRDTVHSVAATRAKNAR